MSESDPSNTHLLFGVPLTRDELIEAITTTIVGIPDWRTTEYVDKASNLVAVGLELLDEVDQVPTDDEGTLLAREEFKSQIALSALAEVKNWHRSRGRSFEQDANPITRHTRTPLRDAKRAQEEETQRQLRERRDQERREMVQATSREVSEIEEKYQVTGKFLRESTYQIDNEKTGNGISLQRAITTIRDNGSQNPLFTVEEARTLAGISLREPEHRYINELKGSIDRLAKLHQRLRQLGGHGAPHGLFAAVGKARELYEAGSPLLNNNALRPLRSMLDITTKTDAEIIRHFVETLDEGPFADCEQLAIAPFEGIELEGSITEIPADRATRQNIEDDINLAVSRSSGDYVVEAERIEQLTILMNTLASRYGEENIKMIRTLKPKWHPLPWYGVLVTQPSDKPPLLVLETPIYGNATYCINDPEWPLLIEHQRTEARTLGARAIIHDDPKDQSGKVFNVAVRMMERSTR